jgi:transposase
MAKGKRRLDQLTIVHPKAAGLDIGSAEIWACVPPNRLADNGPMVGPFRPDLKRLADWLVAGGVDRVAMQSTGVYWLPAFAIREARGLKG